MREASRSFPTFVKSKGFKNSLAKYYFRLKTNLIFLASSNFSNKVIKTDIWSD